ncbi:MAG: TetR/AcrR family transcriptional regulator [Bacteroidales bacterium]|nr:TetR/AcrR family transcriptional regulator [Bacteroidales bacterium]
MKIDPNTKQNIIKASFVLFLEKGYRDLTIKEIMLVTGLSKGAIYHHFKSKEEIYRATLDQYFFALLDPKEMVLKDTFSENIEMIYHFFADLFSDIEHMGVNGIEYPMRRFFSFQLDSEKDEVIREKIFIAVLKFRERIKGLVQIAHDRGQIKTELDIEAVSYHIIALIEGIPLHHSTVKRDVKNELLKKYSLVFDSYLKLICTNS